MQHSIRKAMGGVFATLVVGALGFGGAQALASPAPAAAVPACTIQQCTVSCIQRGYAGGYCNPDAMCVCLGAP